MQIWVNTYSIAMHCRNNMQSLLSMSDDKGLVRSQQVILHRYLISKDKIQSAGISKHSPGRPHTANCMSLTVPKSMHIGNRMTYEAKMWHLPLTEQQEMVILTALTMDHQGHEEKKNLSLYFFLTKCQLNCQDTVTGRLQMSYDKRHCRAKCYKC